MLAIDQVSHYYGEQRAIADASFTCDSGKITCLIGPSGCGKTTLLRLTAGLLELQHGSIHLDQQELASPSGGLPPEQRPIGMVFQEGALFPHLTVARNVGFGLSAGGRGERVAELLDRVGLSQFADRYPESLSGGQRQRVALARALAPQPRALLFDEPYANLDIQLRRTLREDARQMIQDTGTVGVFVTHDPDEVMAVGDHVVVLDHGRIVQQGEPQSLYESPQSLYVAQLFGDSQTVTGTLEGDRLTTPFGEWRRDCLVDTAQADGIVTLVVRPQQLTIAAAAEGPFIAEVRAAGAHDRLLIQSDSSGAQLRIERRREAGATPAVGGRISLEPLPGSVFAAGSGELANENDSH